MNALTPAQSRSALKIGLLLVTLAGLFLCSCRTVPPKAAEVAPATPAAIIPPKPAEIIPPPEPAKATLSTEPPLSYNPEHVPILTFAGANQDGRPTPLWSVKIAPQYRPYGNPLISPDGRWLVLVAETMVLVFDLQEKKVALQTKCPGRIVRLFMDRTGSRLIGIFNASERPATPYNEGQATIGFWTLPVLEFTSRPLLPDFGPAADAGITHAQDRLLASGPDGIIGVFDIATGKQLLRYEAQKKDQTGPYVTYGCSIALSQDDQVVRSYLGGPNANGGLRRWRLADGQNIPTGPEGHDSERNGGSRMTYMRDDRHVLTAWGSWGLTLDRAEDGHSIYSYYQCRYIEYDPALPNVAFTRADTGQFGVINAQTGQLLFEAEVAAEAPKQYSTLHWAILSPDGRIVYTGANYGYILAWDFGQASSQAPDHLMSGTGWTSLIALKGTGAQTLEISTGPRAFDRVIDWDLAQRAFRSSGPALPFPLQEYVDPRWNSTRWRWGSFILKGSICTITGRKGEAKVFEPLTGRTLFHLGAPDTAPDPSIPDGILNIFDNGLSATASPDGTLLAIGSQSAQPLTLWDPRNGHFIKAVDDQVVPLTSVQFSGDGKRFITGDKQGQIAVRSIQSLSKDASPPGSSPLVILPVADSRAYVAHTSSNADGTLIAAVHATGGPYFTGATGSVTVWQDNQEGEWRQLFTYKLPRAPTRVALSPDGRLLAVSQLNFMGKSNGWGQSYGDVLILDAHTGQLRFILTWVDARDLVFLNNHQLATAGNGMQIWTLPGEK